MEYTRICKKNPNHYAVHVKLNNTVNQLYSNLKNNNF